MKCCFAFVFPSRSGLSWDFVCLVAPQTARTGHPLELRNFIVESFARHDKQLSGGCSKKGPNHLLGFVVLWGSPLPQREGKDPVHLLLLLLLPSQANEQRGYEFERADRSHICFCCGLPNSRSRLVLDNGFFGGGGQFVRQTISTQGGQF